MERRSFLRVLGIGAAATVTSRVNANVENVSNVPKPEEDLSEFVITVTDQRGEPVVDCGVYVAEHWSGADVHWCHDTDEKGQVTIPRPKTAFAIRVMSFAHLYAELEYTDPAADGAHIVLVEDRNYLKPF
jgi:hypothetical protein